MPTPLSFGLPLSSSDLIPTYFKPKVSKKSFRPPDVIIAKSYVKTFWHIAYDPTGDQMVQWSSRDNPMPDPFFGGVPIMTSPVYLCDHTELLGAVVFAVTLE